MTKRRKKTARPSKPFVEYKPKQPKQPIYEQDKQDKENVHVTLRQNIIPQSVNQRVYFDHIKTKRVSFCYGCAGSGKTHVAVYQACKMLESGQIKKIILTRPLVQTGKDMGAIPGGVEEKVAPYMIPLICNLEFFLGPSVVKQLIGNKIIQVSPLEIMRGLDFKDTFMCLDEAQNCTFEQLKMFLTRMGTGSKCIIAGDTVQTDLGGYSGFLSVINKMSHLDFVGVSKMNYDDIQRDPDQKRIQIALE